jgi:hypothetical protein
MTNGIIPSALLIKLDTLMEGRWILMKPIMAKTQKSSLD